MHRVMRTLQIEFVPSLGISMRLDSELIIPHYSFLELEWRMPVKIPHAREDVSFVKFSLAPGCSKQLCNRRLEIKGLQPPIRLHQIKGPSFQQFKRLTTRMAHVSDRLLELQPV